MPPRRPPSGARPGRASHRSAPGRPAPTPPELRDAPRPAWLAARILHEDPEVLILDKPAGLPVHPGPAARRDGSATLEDWLPLLQGRKRHLPQPAHRLDTDTAGCLAIGRTKPALAALGALFAAGAARKTYWAVLRGTPAADSGTIDAPLRKHSTRAGGWRIEPHPEGQPARTAWQLLGRTEVGAGEALSWIAFRPLTGRTHQLRVHATLLCGPILGDPFYGTAEDRADGSGTRGLHLLARHLALPLDPLREATAPVPEAMRAAFRRCGWPGD
ncbi:RluA family pseudouridine synthase [Roseomonas elaeocarpi]|uniref:RluA family pseudouridine synthase n=1 Tax=Roseomonas elaeocarpi TaxID=907779 RepID=A0ABV6JVE4_9PROT